MKKKPEMTVSQKVIELNPLKKKKSLKAGNFLQEMKEEMKRVAWTTKEELYTCGKIVIGAIFVLGMGIYVVDLLIRLTLNEVTNLVRLLGA